MPSHDLFRTLCFSRGGNPGEDPIEDHYPIAETAAKVREGDIVVSQYCLSRFAKARTILDNIGLPNTWLHVTETGKTNGTVWAELKAQGYDISEHTGDHAIQDVALPSKHGIHATHVTQHMLTEKEKACGPLGEVMREARLRTWNDNPVLRGLQLHQIEMNFPFLYKVAHLLNAKMVEGGYERLLLCSRDCFLLHHAMEWLFGDEGYEVEYFYTSRLTRYRPSESYAAYARERLSGKTLVVDMNGSGKSLKFMTDMFGGTPLLVCGMGNTVPSLTQNGIRETSNLAPHAMVADFVDGKPVYVNPTNQNWEKPEIVMMHDAFRVCLETLLKYPAVVPEYTLDFALRGMVQDPALIPLWQDHLRDSQAAYDLLNSGPLPHAVVL